MVVRDGRRRADGMALVFGEMVAGKKISETHWGRSGTATPVRSLHEYFRSLHEHSNTDILG